MRANAYNNSVNDATAPNPILVEGHEKPTFQVRLEYVAFKDVKVFPKQSLLAAVVEAGQWWNGQERSYRVVLRVPQASVDAAQSWAEKYANEGAQVAQRDARKKLERRRRRAR